MKMITRIKRIEEVKKEIARIEKRIKLAKHRKVNRYNRYCDYRARENYIDSSYMQTDMYFISEELKKLENQLMNAKSELKHLKRLF